ncbi:MAG: transglutaminase-like domain-containing protein, partial [Geminicoccaceae bacterium]
MKRLCLVPLLCLVATVVDADEAPCSVSAAAPFFDTPRWYGLYFEDAKIGHATSVIQRPGASDDDAILQRFEMTFKLEQVEETVAQARRFLPSEPHSLISGSYQTADRRIDYEQINGGLRLEEGGVVRVWDGLERSLCDEEDIALYRFLQKKPGTGDQLITADFDVENLMLLESTHTVDEAGTRRLFGAEHPFHRLSSVSNNDVFSYSATSRYRNGEGINFFLGPIELRLETEAVAKEPNVGIDLFAEFEKPLDRPLANLDTIEILTLKAILDDPGITIDEVVEDGYLQRVDYLDDRTAIIEIGNYPRPDDGRDPAEFLRPTSAHPADHPRLIAISREIQATLPEPVAEAALAKAILHFVADYIENVPESPYAYNTTSVFDILDNRTGDCTEHSQLFITLARAAGLPARGATGYVYGGDDSAPRLSGHAWVEVHVDGRW